MTSYAERLWPPRWVWPLIVVFDLSFAVAVHVSVGQLWASLLVVVPALVLTWALICSAATVRVENGMLTAGTATIPVTLLGAVEVLDADRARAVRGPESDPTGHHVISGWIPGGIRAEVADPDDPTPYWFVASRRPGALAAAIEQERAQPTA